MVRGRSWISLSLIVGLGFFAFLIAFPTAVGKAEATESQTELQCSEDERTRNECIEQIFESCHPIERLGFGYDLGSMSVSILGLDGDNCIVNITQVIEMGVRHHFCSIPLQAMGAWDSWRTSQSGESAPRDVIDHCETEVFWGLACRIPIFLDPIHPRHSEERIA